MWVMKIDDLPAYIHCKDNDCQLKHFLTINRDIQGKWSAAYVAFGNEGELIAEPLWTNSSDSLSQVALRMSAKLERFNK